MNSNTYHPFVSVCIPTYNNAPLFERCLISILKQSFSDYEIIITDDSTDNIISDLISTKYSLIPNLKYFRNSPRLGSPLNWNEGLRRAQGLYIKIMHHDDWFVSSECLKLFVDSAVSSGAEFVFSNCINVFPKSEKKHKIRKSVIHKWEQDLELILFNNFIGDPSVVLFKKGNVLFDDKFIWLVDVIFYYEYVKNLGIGGKILHIDEYLINVSAGHNHQITNTKISNEVLRFEYNLIDQRYFHKNSLLWSFILTLLTFENRTNNKNLKFLMKMLTKLISKIKLWI